MEELAALFDFRLRYLRSIRAAWILWLCFFWPCELKLVGDGNGRGVQWMGVDGLRTGDGLGD